ncbi:MAG: hypothetical protein DHS20C17_35450 [Cyclobacteriaceae bacterium]|nr:MAG: hypothetical protein DHS20C17_35450 [Cyclobacteriaceae bacterium]
MFNLKLYTMLKIQLTLFALVMFQFACESPENTSPLPKAQVDYNLVSDEFRDMFEGAFRNAESLQLASVTELTEKQMTVKLEVENISKSTAEHLEGYFGEIPLLQQRTIYPLPPSYLYGTQSDKFENLDSMVNRSDVLSDAQKMYIKSLRFTIESKFSNLSLCVP